MFCFQDINWGTFGWTLGVMLIIALVLGGLIILVSKFFSVEKDTRVDEIVEHLPKANCGACGHPGCEGFAQALVNGTADVDDCKVSSKEQKIEIANILGKSFSGGEETVAVVACNGGNNCQDKYAYQGYGNCQAQVMLSGGRKACPVGCMGAGSCADICPSAAIKVKEGVAVVDPDLCISCGLCMQTCPKKIIKRIPKSAKIYVACSTQCKGKEVMAACKAGCIACGICERTCKYGAIHLVNNVPVIDYSKCVGCKECMNKCPRKVIKERNE